MKSKTKRVLSLLLASIMTLSAAACSSDTNNSDSNNQTDGSAADTSKAESSQADSSQSTTSGGFTDYSAGFPDGTTIRIPTYDRGWDGWNPTDNYYVNWIKSEVKEKYNINVEYVSINRTNEVQDYMQLIAAGTAPDIIMHYDMPQAVNYYGEGAIQNVNYDEVAFYAPDYWAKLQDTIETYGKLDGNNAFIFAQRDAIYYQWVGLIRQDWLDRVGMDVPTTYEENLAVLEAWKEAGLGTAGSSLVQNAFTFYYGWIDPSTPKEELALYLDLNVSPMTWEPVERWLRDQNDLYNKGYIDPDFYLRTDDAAIKAEFMAGRTGTYGFYLASNTDVFSTFAANNPDGKLAISKATPAEGYVPYYYENPPYGMIMGINEKTGDVERAAVYTFLNWMIQPENLFYLQHGPEGKTHTMNGTVAVHTTDYTGEERLSNNDNKDIWCLVAEVVSYGDEQTNLEANKTSLAPSDTAGVAPNGTDLVQEAYDNWKANEQNGLISPIFTKVISSSQEYSADLKELWKTAYVDIVTSSPDQFDAKYEKYCQEYLDAGFQEILDEKQALIDEGSVLYVE